LTDDPRNTPPVNLATLPPARTAAPADATRTLGLASLVAALGGFLFGYDTAVINGANQYITLYFGLTPMQEGFAGASAILGCIPGAMFAGYFSDRFGRRKVLFMCAVLFALSALLSAIPRSLAELLSARFIGGLGIGAASMVCPVYIAEMAPAARRGRLGTLFQLGIVTGIFLTLFINLGVQRLGDEAWNTTLGWRWMLGLETLPAVAFIGLLFVVPESPRWLVQADREPEARAVLERIVPPAEAAREIGAVKAVLGEEQGSFWDLFRTRFRRPLVVAVVIMAVSQFSGINAIIYYSTKIFASAGIGVGSSFASSAVVGLVNLLFTLVAIALVDKAGRRPLLLVGLAVQVVALVTVGCLFYAGYGGLGLLVAIVAFIAAFAMALGPISWLLCSEIFPAKVRGRAMSVAAFTVWVSCYIVAQTFPMLNDSPIIGPAKTFWVYAASSLAGLIFVLAFVPETKGRTLEEIEREWNARANRTA
jgi:MFS transporter, SP family, arabinose:H+ symporter